MNSIADTVKISQFSCIVQFSCNLKSKLGSYFLTNESFVESKKHTNIFIQIVRNPKTPFSFLFKENHLLESIMKMFVSNQFSARDNRERVVIACQSVIRRPAAVKNIQISLLRF